MPKLICKKHRCNKLVEKGLNNGYCDDHKDYGVQKLKEANKYRVKSYNQIRKDTKETKFYNSKSWSKLKERVLANQHYLCQDCYSKGILNSNNLEVHHIIPIKENYDLALNENNLKVLCRSCHKKTHDKLNKFVNK